MSIRVSLLIASDHAGVAFKESLKACLPGIKFDDLGPSSVESVDYPDYAEMLSRQLLARPNGLGVLICGSGIGMSIAANKIPGIRAALVSDPISARLSREHNDANVLCFGARFIAPEYAAEMIRVWLTAEASRETRHQIRLQKLSALEQ